MIQLLSTPTSNIPLSPPTSPAVRDAALPPDGTTPATTFVDSPTWRPYRSHLARIVMAFPATSPTASPNPRRKSFSFGVGGGGATVDAKTAAAGKELVIDGARVTVMADNLEIDLSGNAATPFLRPAGSNLEKGGTQAERPPLSPPSSPSTRKKRLSFANALPFLGKSGGEQQKARGGDDSALDLEEHPDVGPDGVRQLRMKTAESAPVSTAAEQEPAAMPVSGSVFAEADVGQATSEHTLAAPEWPLVVNGAPLAQITIPLGQLSHSAIGMTSSRAMTADKTAAGPLSRTPAAFTVNIPATAGATSPSAMGKDVYDGPATLRVEFQSTFSSDTEAQTLLQMTQLALDRLGIKPSEGSESSGLKLTRTISRGLTGRRKSSAGEEGRPVMERSTSGDLDEHDRNANYWNAMRYQ